MAATQPATQISSLVDCQVCCLEETWLGVQESSSAPSLAYDLEQFLFSSLFSSKIEIKFQLKSASRSMEGLGSRECGRS